MPRNRRYRARLGASANVPPTPGPKHDDYKIEVQPLPCAPHEDQQYYWHLFYKGEKINGGIADYESWARERAVIYKYEHHRDVFLRRSFWDAEDSRWRSREVIS